MKKTNVIGLTGQTGAGKTQAGKFFEDIGYAVIDADIISKKLLISDKDLKNDVTTFFGKDIFNDDKINFKLLANKVFNDEKLLKRLNDLTHPKITEVIKIQVKNLSEEGHANVILDAALLYESKLIEECDYVVSVISSAEKRLKRIKKRDKISEEEARQRMNSQKSEEFYKSMADFIIYNDNSMIDLKTQVLKIDDFIKNQEER